MIELQPMTPVRESLVWTLLSRFYEEKGPGAWKEGLVPQGSTANCFTADTYAAVAAAFLRDMQAQGCTERPIIIELGGGNGRFAWQFLNRLINYQFGKEERCPPFTYMLTDLAASNVESWKAQARFSRLIDSGCLEFAQLSVCDAPVLETANGPVTPAMIGGRPTIIIANYLFDCIPSDMVRIRDHKIHHVLMSLESPNAEFLEQPITGFSGVKEKFSARRVKGEPTTHPVINRILENYAELEGDFQLPVPETAIRFLEAFMDRDAPMMMLAGDLAYSDPDEFSLGTPFIFDSYFAHYTNFPMFAELFRLNGGEAQFQRQKDPNFACGAFLYPGRKAMAGGHSTVLDTTRIAAASNLKEFNPFDAHELIELINETVGEASFRQIFAWIRFSKFDPVVAETCLPIVFELLEQGQEQPDEQQLYECFIECYRAYFPDGADVTIDIAIAQLCLAIKFNDEALDLVEAAIREFGPKPARHYVHALVLLRLNRDEDARAALQAALALDPTYGPALRLHVEKFEPAKAAKAIEHAHFRLAFSDPELTNKTHDIFDTMGVVLIDDLLSPELIRELKIAHADAVANWQEAGLGTPNNVGDKRFTVPIRMKAPFNDPALFANPVIMDMLTTAMGEKPIINAFGAVETRAGAKMQHVHREHPLLFRSDDVNAVIPTYAVTMLIPLIDLDEEAGGTQLWEKTHKLPTGEKWQGDPSVVYTRAGSALTFDYRVYHGGMPCRADHGRPMIFLSYSLPWFKDTLAFESHAALAITEAELQAIPEEHRDMFRFAVRRP